MSERRERTDERVRLSTHVWSFGAFRLGDILLYGLLTIYVELVFPRGFTAGFGLHPLFFLMPSYYRVSSATTTEERDGGNGNSPNEREALAQNQNDDDDRVESVPPEIKSRRKLRILGLTKRFCSSIKDWFGSKSTPAVNELTFDLYEGEFGVWIAL